jgi:hypothetical protein
MAKLSVFVLGAGASAPFQYPLGSELVRRVLRFNGDAVLGVTKEQARPFKDALYRSGAYSVDAFLERNLQYVDIGRLIIAHELVKCEQYSNLWMDFWGPELVPVDNWYKFLFSRIVRDVPFEKVSEWPVKFITFNYDRSLEHFLFEATKNLYAKTDAEVAAALEPIEVIHVHGHLGLLPWQKGAAPKRPYDTEHRNGQAVMAANQIKILHEADESSPEFERARQVLSVADQIYVLGFGYHPTNIRRLGLVKGATSVEPVGTWVGLTRAERASINSKGCNVTFWGDMGGEGIVEFLRNYQLFLDREWIL